MSSKIFILLNNSRKGVAFRIALFPCGVQYRLAKATSKKHASRYYASWLGRWTAADPAGLVDGVNLYVYCRGNPIILNDPNGRQSSGELFTETFTRAGKTYRNVEELLGPSVSQGSRSRRVDTNASTSIRPTTRNEATLPNVLVDDIGLEDASSPQARKKFGEGNTTGDTFKRQAVKAASSGNDIGMHFWAAVAALWDAAGFESISTVTDKIANTGEKVGTGEWVSTGFELASVVPIAKIGQGLKLLKPAKAAGTGVQGKQLSRSVGELRAEGLKDAHHIVQDAAVRDLPGYQTNVARGIQLKGPPTLKGSPHYSATQVQRQAGGGTLGAELRIGYKAMRRSGVPASEARIITNEAMWYFKSLGYDERTITKIPKNRR